MTSVTSPASRIRIIRPMKRTLLISALLFGVLAPVARAHHSFAAKWDANNCKDFVGILTKIDWQNPHPYFFVDIKNASGKVESWSFQAYSPVTLRRNGTDRQMFRTRREA